MFVSTNQYEAFAYVSRAQNHFSTGALDALAEASARINAQNEITGYLYYRNGTFFQYVEGSGDELHSLLERLRHDSRHVMEAPVWLPDSAERLFPSWNMKHYTHDALCEIKLEDVVVSTMNAMLGKSDPDWVAARVNRIVRRIAATA